MPASIAPPGTSRLPPIMRTFPRSSLPPSGGSGRGMVRRKSRSIASIASIYRSPTTLLGCAEETGIDQSKEHDDKGEADCEHHQHRPVQKPLAGFHRVLD